jgi:formylglycine-generating enzyme required for sulfatase activity
MSKISKSIIMAALLFPAIVQARLALVIGNADYRSDALLSNPVNDATDLAAALKNRLGFEVIHRTNLTVKEMRSSIKQFGQQLRGMGLFYYAGHGMQLGNENYLIPIGAERALFSSRYNLDKNTIKASFILETMQDAGNQVNIIILDACRENPFEIRGRERRPGGLTLMTAPGSLIAYAARAGEVALDGKGKRNSPYTASLIDEIRHNQNLSILQLFTRVRAAVRDKTDELQSPGFYSELDQDFCLVGECGNGDDLSELIYKVLNWWQPVFVVVIAIWVIWLGWRQKWVSAVVVAWAEYRATKIEQRRQLENAKRKAAAIAKQKADAEKQKRAEEEKRRRLEMAKRKAAAIAKQKADAEKQKRAEEEKRRQAEEKKGKLFQFETVTVNAQGKIIKRTPKKARYQTEDLGNGVTLEMVYIPEGRFLMGSPKTEKGRYSDEGPQHQVTLEPFYMGKYPVTQAQYEAVMGKNPSYFNGKNRPVERVYWNDAVAFCKRLSEMTGRTYRLPSEAQWEYAARAGTTTPFYFGETITSELANYNYNIKETTDVGSFPPNAFGLYDMHGNVWEWCADTWHKNYEGAPTDGSVWEKEPSRNNRVLRGGSWSLVAGLCRTASRDWLGPGVRDDGVGFRVVWVART